MKIKVLEFTGKVPSLYRKPAAGVQANGATCYNVRATFRLFRRIGVRF